MKLRTEQFKSIIKALLLGLAFLLVGMPELTFAKDITLQWNANQESDVAWYNIYFRDLTTQESWQEPGPAHDPSASVVTQQIFGLDETTQYCFKVTALTDSGIESPFSKEVCTAGSEDVAAAVEVTSPNGNENLVAGRVKTLTWASSPNAVTYNLRYSTDKGASWKVIDNVTNINSYRWRLPNVNSNKVLFKVKAKNANGVVIGSDRSDATFTVKRVRVNSPNGTETLKAGTLQTLTWAASPKAETYVLRYSTDRGATWKLISKVSNVKSYTWKVPNIKSSNVLFKVSAKNASGKTIGADRSDTVFTII